MNILHLVVKGMCQHNIIIKATNSTSVLLLHLPSVIGLSYTSYCARHCLLAPLTLATAISIHSRGAATMSTFSF